MDKKFIDADVLLNNMGELYDKYDPSTMSGYNVRLGIVKVRNIVDRFPAADVQEVRRGKWLIGDWKSKKGKARYMCSECRSIEKMRKFCPNCGAKMNEESE